MVYRGNDEINSVEKCFTSDNQFTDEFDTITSISFLDGTIRIVG